MPHPITAKYDWILAITSMAFVFSAASNGANDVANAYATSVAARTLKMWHVGIMAIITEFVGAVALGDRVTSTIKSGIITPTRFEGNPGTFMLAMGCAEVGSATWLTAATFMGWPVSTTQTIVGALVGVGFATGADITWRWTGGSVSQVAASWGIAPAIACAFSAIIFGTLKYTVLERQDPLKWGLRLIPWYIAFTGGVLALFITIEAPTAPSLEEFGAGKAAGIILGCFFGCLFIGYVFFMPYFHRRLVQRDARIRFYHVPLGPLLYRENPPLYYPRQGEWSLTNHYEDAYGVVNAGGNKTGVQNPDAAGALTEEKGPKDSDMERQPDSVTSSPEITPKKRIIEPEERFLDPVRELSWINPAKWWGYAKYCFLQGVTRDVISHDSALLRDIHSRARRYDDRVEHMWTYCQVISAMMMSIAHGSNDVANAVGPWVGSYHTYNSGEVDTKADTPVWFLVLAGLLLGGGFWFYGYHIMRALGNKITQMSPTRGFATELGAAITVLLASRLSLPVSTTQCLTGSAVGVALMNYDLASINWRQIAFIFSGWILTLPSAGLISGLLCLMALNAPHF
ncbi:phosphate transporter [Aspergillus carlsbadensis]|nr:phosphate transporter [Aspergillus carlsbadensis]